MQVDTLCQPLIFNVYLGDPGTGPARLHLQDTQKIYLSDIVLLSGQIVGLQIVIDRSVNKCLATLQQILICEGGLHVLKGTENGSTASTSEMQSGCRLWVESRPMRCNKADDRFQYRSRRFSIRIFGLLMSATGHKQTLTVQNKTGTRPD